jgi:hypothetical protein
VSRQPARNNESWLVTKFLGADAASGGPFALLGFDPADSGDEAVLLALRARLNQTSQHPEGATPEADEVRLALHAAAAQLLDARTRQAMVARWAGAMPHATGSRADAPAMDATQRNVMLLQHDAVMAIAACGGWNERARSRLMLMAQSRGLGPELVQVAVAQLEGTTAAHASVRATGAAQNQGAFAHVPSTASKPLPAARASPWRRRLPAPVLLAIALVLSGVVVVLSFVLLASSSGKGAPAQPTAAPTVAATPSGPETPRDTQGQLFPTTPSPKPVPTSPASAPATTDAQRWVQKLNTAVTALATDQEAARAEAMALLSECASRWVSIEGPDLTVVQRCIIDAIYQAESTDAAVQFLDAVEGPAAQSGTRARVLRDVWRAGVLTRLSRERDLPATLHAILDERLSSSLAGERPSGEPAFEAGVLASLTVLANSIAAEGSWEEWSGWLAAVEAVARAQPNTRTSLLLVGLTEAIGPIAKPGNARFVAESSATLPWHREPSAQRWLIARFDGLDTSRDALVILTRALTSKSSVPGIDATMVLGVSAGESDRRSLRDRYALAFGFESVADASALDARLSETIAHLNETHGPALAVEDALREALSWALVSEAAWLRWRGVTERASIALDRVNEPRTSLSAPAPSARQVALRRDEPPEWARAYINAGADIAARTTLLRQYPGTGAHPADAEVALGEALRGSPVQVREAARTVVEAMAISPIMVNAMLEAIPTAPRTLATADIIAALTGRLSIAIDDREWRSNARRALVERLLELMAARGDYANTDALQIALAQSHAVRAAPSPEAAVATRAAPVPPLEASLLQERSAWRTSILDLTRPRTYPESLAGIEAGASARSRLASGVIQRTVVAQHEIARLMGLTIASESPDRAARAWEVVSELNERLASAPNVGVQVRDCERAMALLWEIRIRPEETPP